MFDAGEIVALDHSRAVDPEGMDAPEDALPMLEGPIVSKPGDLWLLGRHKLIGGYAQDRNVFAALMGKCDTIVQPWELYTGIPTCPLSASPQPSPSGSINEP